MTVDWYNFFQLHVVMLLIWLLEIFQAGRFNPCNQKMVPPPQPLIKHMLVSILLYVADSIQSDLNTSMIK